MRNDWEFGANDLLVAAASDAAAGLGWMESLSQRERAFAAELYWQRIGRPAIEQLDGNRRPGAVASIVERLGGMPIALRDRLRFGLHQGADMAVRLETTRWLVTLLRRAPWAMSSFPNDEIRFADYVVQALESGVYEGHEDQVISWADRHVPLRRPPVSFNSEEVETIREAALSGFGPFTAVRRALEGGRPLDPKSADDQILGAIFWREVNGWSWHEAAPAVSAQRAVDFVIATRIVPSTLLADLHAGLAAADPRGAERTARTIAALIDALPETVELFAENELERANLINQATSAGKTAEEAIRYADGFEPSQPPADPIAAGTAVEAAAATWGAGLSMVLTGFPAAPLIGGTMKSPASYGNLDGYLIDLYRWSPAAAERLLIRMTANPDVSDPRSQDGLKEIKANQARYQPYDPSPSEQDQAGF